MKLYLRPGACSLAVHIVLREVGAEFETVEVDLATKLTKDGADYRDANPKGQVPALLLDSSELLTEGPVINQYLADTHPDSQLLPAVGTLARYRVLEWLNFTATELHKTISPLMRPTTSAEVRSATIAQLQTKLAWVDQQIVDGQFLTGTAFTIADAYLFVIASWLPRIGVDASAYPALGGYCARVAARPAVRAALAAEGLA